MRGKGRGCDDEKRGEKVREHDRYRVLKREREQEKAREGGRESGREREMERERDRRIG